MSRPTPCPTSERTTASPSRSTTCWMAWETSPTRLPGSQRSTPASRERLVASSRRCASGEIAPIGKVRAASGAPPADLPADSDRVHLPAAELVAAGDAVHDHRVGGGADRAGEPPVALEGR